MASTSERVQRLLTIGISADTSQARSDLQALDRVLKSTTSVEDLARRQKALNAEFKAGEITQQQYARAMAVMDAQAAKAAKSLAAIDAQASRGLTAGNSVWQRETQRMQQVEERNLSLMGMGRRFAPLAVAAGGADLLRRSVGVYAETEAQRKGFEVMTGSAGEADRVMAGLRIPGIQFSAATKSAQSMLGYGMDGRDIPATVRQIAAITRGDNERMQNMALAFSQIQGNGRLMGQELLQLVNAGFNPLQEISKRTGESLGELKKRMEAGGVSSREVADAFKAATSEGGRFNGMLEAMATTTSGQFARLKANAEQVQYSIGKLADPAIQKSLGELNFLMAGLNSEIQRMTPGGPKNPVTDFQSWVTTVNEMNQYRQTAIGGLANAFNSQEAIDKQNENVRIAFEARRLDELRKRDPSELTADQKSAITMADRFERRAKFTTNSEYTLGRSNYDRQLALSNGDDRARLQADFLERHGPGRFSDAELEEAKKAQARMAELSERTANEKRVGEIFNSQQTTARNRIIDFRYGENAESVKSLWQQSAGDERRKLDALIGEGASYREIRESVNEIARLEADRLSSQVKLANSLHEQTRETERLKREEERNADWAKDRLKDLDSETQYRRELLQLGRDEADVRRTMRDRGLDRDTASEIRTRERRLELMETSASPGNVLVPKAMQAGSQEAAAAVARSQSAAISDQIRALNEANRLARLQLDRLTAMDDKLQELDVI